MCKVPFCKGEIEAGFWLWRTSSKVTTKFMKMRRRIQKSNEEKERKSHIRCVAFTSLNGIHPHWRWFFFQGSGAPSHRGCCPRSACRLPAPRYPGETRVTPSPMPTPLCGCRRGTTAPSQYQRGLSLGNTAVPPGGNPAAGTNPGGVCITPAAKRAASAPQ